MHVCLNLNSIDVKLLSRKAFIQTCSIYTPYFTNQTLLYQNSHLCSKEYNLTLKREVLPLSHLGDGLSVKTIFIYLEALASRLTSDL